MTRFLALGLSLSTVAAAAAAVFFDRETHAREVAQARSERVATLTAPDGWLTLVGLHFLKSGENRIGRTGANDVVIAAGPDHLGIATLTSGGRVTLTLATGVDARIGGAATKSAELQSEASGTPTLVTTGTLTLFVTDRGGRKALRVRDSAAKRRIDFAGVDYFPIDPAWRVEAQWMPFERSRQIPLTNTLGQISPALVPGKAVFEHEGRTYELLPIDEGSKGPLLFVISDATSGKDTYAAARFLYAERPQAGKIVLDFNLACNPPCVFTPLAACPLPPKENRLPFAVPAGEKNYRGMHE